MEREVALEALYVIKCLKDFRSMPADFREDYCKHGRYVGGCGADYMCHWCEDGTSDYHYAIAIAKRRVKARRQQHAQEVLLPLLSRVLKVPAIKSMDTQSRENIVSGFCALI